MKASSKTGKKVKKTIPWSLHMAIVRLQGTEELEYDEACVRAAVLIEEGGEKFTSIADLIIEQAVPLIEEACDVTTPGPVAPRRLSLPFAKLWVMRS